MKGFEIKKKWSSFTKENIEKVPDRYGVYELADKDKKIVYIGHGRLRDRLQEHFRDKDKKECVYFFRYEKTNRKEEAEQRERSLLERFERENKRLPKLNDRKG